MSRINIAGVVKGGLVAGVIMNISEAILNMPVLGARMEAELRAINLEPPGNDAIVTFTILTFALGFLAVYLYAAIRTRFGPGLGTAVVAGLMLWMLSYGFTGVTIGALGINSWGLVGLVELWTLVECLVATAAGAYFYKE